MNEPGAEHPTGSLQSGSIVDEVTREQGFLDVVVVSPARPVFEGRAKHLSVMAKNGSIGIWPRHTDLVSALGIGSLSITGADGATTTFAIAGGFLKVGGPRVTVLIDKAATAAEVDRAAVEKELEETKAALQHPGSDENFQSLLDQRSWLQAQLKLRA
ncbi:MAG: ATP synthase F1 subunit epsilon [Planctomycetota bacterium]